MLEESSLYDCEYKRYTTRLRSDGEVGTSGRKELSVGVGGTALAVANGEVNLVNTGLEELVLSGLGAEGELGRVLVGGHAGVQDGITEGHALGGDNAEGKLASGGLVEDGVEDVNLEVSALGTSGGGDGDLVNLDSAAIVDGAGVEDLAEIDGVDVLAVLLEHLDESVDANTVAKEVADTLLSLLAGEGLAAELVAATEDAGVEDDVQELVDALAHEVVLSSSDNSSTKAYAETTEGETEGRLRLKLGNVVVVEESLRRGGEESNEKNGSDSTH